MDMEKKAIAREALQALSEIEASTNMENLVKIRRNKMKKLLKKILKALNRKAESKNREIARHIGEYYLEKNNFDYKKTEEDIRILGITQIDHKGDTIIVTLQSCGMLIGRRGENIEQLQKFLFGKTKYSKLNIKEDNIISWLIPISYNFEDYEIED